MKQLLVFTSALLFIGFVSCTGTNGSNKKMPANAASDTANFTTIQWLDSIHNFGTAKYGEKVKIAYTFKNTGSKPLYITNVHPTCGCTIADYTQQAVLPGDEGKINALFDTKHGVPGNIRKSIVVSSNTTNDTHFVLAFTGTVVK